MDGLEIRDCCLGETQAPVGGSPPQDRDGRDGAAHHELTQNAPDSGDGSGPERNRFGPHPPTVER